MQFLTAEGSRAHVTEAWFRFNNIDNDNWSFLENFEIFFIVKMAECDEKLAVHGLNVSHIGLAVKPNGLERGTRSCQSSKKKRRDFFCISFENSQFTVILQTFLSGWGPLPPLPKKANYTECLTLTQLYKQHNGSRNRVADTMISHRLY